MTNTEPSTVPAECYRCGRELSSDKEFHLNNNVYCLSCYDSRILNGEHHKPEQP